MKLIPPPLFFLKVLPVLPEVLVFLVAIPELREARTYELRKVYDYLLGIGCPHGATRIQSGSRTAAVISH